MGMSRGYARFTQADIRRAIKAVEKSGAEMTIAITSDGTILIARTIAEVQQRLAGVRTLVP